LVFFISCEERRDFELNDFKKEMVLNAIITTDLIWDVDLSYTKSIFDETEFSQIDHASVKVVDLVTDQSFFLNLKKTGHYGRQLHPVEGHTYKISVNVPEREELSAITYVPSVLDVKVNSTVLSFDDEIESVELDIEITDNPDEQNYYVWELVAVDPLLFTESSQEAGTKAIATGERIQNRNDIEIEVSNQETKPINELSPKNIFTFDKFESIETPYQRQDLNTPSFISDEEAEGGKISNKLIINNSVFATSLLNETGTNSESIESLIPLFELKIMAVSSDLYNYLKSYEIYKQSDIKNTSFSDPVIIYSNIENGLGIFGGYNLKSFYIY
jgi:hypothetical protein